MATQTNRKFAVITGASSGIGFELAKQCLEHDMDILVCAEDAALSQRGTRYRSGGSRPGGFDCSGLVQWSYRQAGLYLPRTAAAQSRVGARVSLSQIRPGDLIFYSYGGGVGHVAMAAGDGMLIESSQSGHPVAKRRIYTRGLAVIRRVALTVHSSTDTP